ncbi:hypothetical protein HDE_00744 [Halotydeus destructor]|nr:hypothetical protein HDE_00744 [Halotydeus destructor]
MGRKRTSSATTPDPARTRSRLCRASCERSPAWKTAPWWVATATRTPSASSGSSSTSPGPVVTTPSRTSAAPPAPTSRSSSGPRLARRRSRPDRQATSTGRSGLLPDKFNPPLYHPEAHEASESAEEAEEAEAPEQDGPVAADEREGPEYVHELDQDVHHPDVHEIDQVDQLQPPGQSDSQPETTLAPKRSTQASDTKVTFDDDLETETVSRSPFEDDEDIIKILESVRVTDTAHGDLAHSSDKPTSTEKPQASLEDVLTVLRLFPKSNGGVPRDRLSVATTALANLAQWTTEGPTARMATAELSTTTETPTTEVQSTETTAYPTPTNELAVSTDTNTSYRSHYRYPGPNRECADHGHLVGDNNVQYCPHGDRQRSGRCRDVDSVVVYRDIHNRDAYDRDYCSNGRGSNKHDKCDRDDDSGHDND